MDLGILIRTLRERGDELTSWYGVETNIESAELKHDNEKYSVELKVKKD